MTSVKKQGENNLLPFQKPEQRSFTYLKGTGIIQMCNMVSYRPTYQVTDIGQEFKITLASEWPPSSLSF